MRIKSLTSALGLALLFLGLNHSLWAVDAALGKQWMVYGNAQYSQKKYDDAIKSYGNSLRADNTNAAVYQGLGNCYYGKGDKASALKYYKYSLQLNPQNTALASLVASLGGGAAAGGAGGAGAIAYANTYYGRKNYDYAIYYYNQDLKTNPNNAKAYQGLGNCYYAKGDKVNAASNYQKALDLDPNNTQLKTFLAAYAPAGSMASLGGGGDKDWVSPAWRSAIFPGWGQFYNGESTKGLIIGGVTWAMLIGVIATYEIGSSAESTYLAVGNDPTKQVTQADFDGPYSQWDQMASLNHTLYYAFGVAWAYGIIDSIWNAKPAQRVGYLEPPLSLAFTGDGFRADYKLLTF